MKVLLLSTAEEGIRTEIPRLAFQTLETFDPVATLIAEDIGARDVDIGKVPTLHGWRPEIKGEDGVSDRKQRREGADYEDR